MKARALTTAAVAALSLAFVFGSATGSQAAQAAPKDPTAVFACTLEYQPVCGTLNQKSSTFGNMCQAKQAGATNIRKGPCK
jgi:hypothetical protein